MNDSALLKGVVSAYDANTGKVIFANQHNVVTALAKVYTLNLLVHNGSISIDSFYTPNADDRAYLLKMLNMSLNEMITKFTIGYDSSASYPTEYEEKTLDASFGTFPIGFFDGTESYRPSDIPDETDAKKARIIYTRENGAFARFKLSVKGSGDTGNVMNISNNRPQPINTIRLIGSSEGNPVMTQFRFPEINFYSTTQVDFEYRLYL
jgi:hypothetical protein